MYDDIINLPHHVSAARPQMSMMDRAAQFSPFAALTGYDAAIKETARLTDQKIELDDYEKEEINDKIQLIAEHLGEDFEIVITYFQPDGRKAVWSCCEVSTVSQPTPGRWCTSGLSAVSASGRSEMCWERPRPGQE